MDPHLQRGFLVSGQRPPEMNLQPPDKDSNLGHFGTPALMNQFYPGSREADPVNDVNNLPVPDRNYHHQPVIDHDKLVISSDVMLSRAVTGSRSDDELIQLSQEQNGTARVFSSLSPGLLDTQYEESPRNSPENTDMMDYGMFDLGPDQDEIIHRVQFSDSNFAPPASGEHPIENDLAMETQGEASHDAHGDALESDPERPTYANAQNQLDHNADSLPIAPAQFAHGAGQFDDHADFYDEPQPMLPLGNKFRADQDVSWHEGQLHVEQTLETSGQTYYSAQHVSNSDASYVVGALDQPIGCQPANLANFLPARDAALVPSARNRTDQADTAIGEFSQRRMGIQPHTEWQDGALREEAPQSSGNHFYQKEYWGQPTIGDRQAGHMPMGPVSCEQGDYYRQMEEVHQQAERQQYNRNGALETSGQTYNFAQNSDAPPVVWGPSQQMGCQPTNPAEVLPISDAPHGSGACYSRRFTPSGTAVTWNHQIANDRITGRPGNCRLDFQRIERNIPSASLSGHTDGQISSSEDSGVYSFTSTPDQTTIDGSSNGLHPPIFTYEDAPNGTNFRYQGVESGSYQINSGNVEAADNVTGGPGNCRFDFQRIKKNTRSASLSDHTDDQNSSIGESGFYSSPSTPDQTTTDGSTNGLLPPIVTSEEPPLNQLFLPNFTVQSKDDEAFQQAQWDILMDYSDEELERMDNNGFLLIDNNDTIGFDVDRLCDTYEYYASGMNSMLPLDILSNNEVEHFSSTGVLMSDNNEGSSSSSSSLAPEKKRRNRRSGIKMTPEQKRIHKKEANRKYSTISRDKKKSERDITNRIWKYVQNEIQIQQAATKDVENNVAFANELLELTGQASDLHGVLQQESQFYMYWKGEISRISDIRRDEDTKVKDALLRKQSAKEKFEKSGEEYQAKDGGKKTTTIGSQKTRALQSHELVNAQYNILVNRHDLRREKFLKGLADLYFRRTVSRYIQRIRTIPVEVHQLLNQEQKLHQLDKLENFLRANRHLLEAPS